MMHLQHYVWCKLMHDLEPDWSLAAGVFLSRCDGNVQAR